MRALKTITFGCKVNQSDTALMEHNLHGATGCAVNEDGSLPDVVLINTCTVTASADRQARQTIRKMHRLYPGAKIIVTGCYAESNPAEIKKIQGVHMLLPLAGQSSLAQMFPPTASMSFTPKAYKYRKTRYTLKMQDGCNAYCSFCILPYVRGRSRSIDPQDILRHLKTVESDYREIVLTGTHLGAFGRDLEPRMTLSGMVRKMLHESREVFFRISSLEPSGVTAEFIRMVSEEERIRPHFHVPLQSGSASVLRRMNRKYSPKNYEDRVKALAQTRPHVAIGADVIVGFPGETPQEFNETVSFIKSLPLTYLHVFPYSSRPGTKSERFQDDVAGQVKKERLHVLRELSDKKKLTFMEKFLNKVQPVLLESKKNGAERLSGYTPHYLPVRVKGHARLVNRDVEAMMTAIHKNDKGEFFVEAVIQ